MDDAYTVTYYDPLTEESITETYITPDLRDARIELLIFMGYEITDTQP